MSLPEAIIAQIQDPRLSDVNAFDVYLDYITGYAAEERFVPLDTSGNAQDPNEHSFAQVLTAFRNWFSPESKEFEAFMGRLIWDRENIKHDVERNHITALNVYTWTMQPLSTMGDNYLDHIFDSPP